MAVWNTAASPPHTGNRLPPCCCLSYTEWHHPRTRGFDDESEGMQSDQQGITPVHGDSTNKVRIINKTVWLHPRTRGIDTSCRTIPFSELGFTPVHGEPIFQRSICRCFFGITPAYRESTMTQCMRSRSQWLHPRTQGIDNPISPLLPFS